MTEINLKSVCFRTFVQFDALSHHAQREFMSYRVVSKNQQMNVTSRELFLEPPGALAFLATGCSAVHSIVCER